MKELYLKINDIPYLSSFDKTMFIDWLNEIKCIKVIQEKDSSIEMEIELNKISVDELNELWVIFIRYRIDLKLLKTLANDTNCPWLLEEPDFKPFRRRPDWENTDANILELDAIKYFSEYDEEVFWTWLEEISCIIEEWGSGTSYFIKINSDKLNDNNLKLLFSFFARYRVNLEQLKIFINDNNRHWAIPWIDKWAK